VKALRPLPQRARSPEPPPDELELSPDAKAVRTMLALGNLRIGRPATAFYAEAFDYMTRARTCPHCGAAKTVTAETKEAAEPSAIDRAKAAIEASPDRSNRSIASEIGVDEGTVRKARKNSALDSAVDIRVGRDGRRRRVPGDQDHLSPQEKRDAYRGAF